MKALIQRVRQASVKVEGRIVGEISSGLLVFLGIEKGDEEKIASKLLEKILKYRVFADTEGKMNLGLQAVEGEMLIVSQFTLVADTRKGLRPSFTPAAVPEVSEELYDYFIERAKESEVRVAAGQFGADMDVSLVNSGPVTFMLSE